MYCSSCGGAVTNGSSYCNHCGVKLGAAKEESVAKPAELSLESLVWAIVSVFIVGLGTIIGLMAVLKEVLRAREAVINTVIFLSFALLLVVEGSLIWLLMHHRSAVQTTGKADDALSGEYTTRELETTHAHALPPAAPSVTEHTTRAFEPVYAKKKSKE